MISGALGATSIPRQTAPAAAPIEVPPDALMDPAALTSDTAPQGPALRALPDALPSSGSPIVPNPAAPALPDVPLAVRSYTVEPGDSVRTIAHQFGVTNETIIWENDLTDPDALQVGQHLQILPFSGLIHEVRPGDTLASVANSYDARIPDVVSANKLTEPYIIAVGQKLTIPGGYRPLPKKVVPLTAPSSGTGDGSGSASDTVQAPPGSSDQVAAVINTPAKRVFPRLGNTPQEQFIASIGEAAVDSADRTGVPASVTIAQAILESYWGSSRLARDANNYFGIKSQTKAGPAGSVWFDVWEVIGGRNVVQSQAFRAYNTIAESFIDHGLFFVENARYGAAMAAKDDARQFAREINRAGYATDPAYASKLIGLMDRYDLYRYDDL